VPACWQLSHRAELKPGAGAADYSGTATSDNLSIMPSGARLQVQTCSFCANAGGTPGGLTAADRREIMLDGFASLLIQDDQGHRIGYDGGTFVKDFPDAEANTVRSGAPLEPHYVVPAGRPLTVTLDGTGLVAADTANVLLIGGGYDFGVEGVSLDPGQKDTIRFSADWSEVSYETAGNETPTLVLGITTEGADWAFDIKSAGEASGQTIDLKIDLALQQLRVKVSAADGEAGYDITVYRIDPVRGEEIFTHSGNTVASTDTVVLEYGTWLGNGMAMKVGLDQGGDGTIDAEQDVSDQN